MLQQYGITPLFSSQDQPRGEPTNLIYNNLVTVDTAINWNVKTENVTFVSVYILYSSIYTIYTPAPGNVIQCNLCFRWRDKRRDDNPRQHRGRLHLLLLLLFPHGPGLVLGLPEGLHCPQQGPQRTRRHERGDQPAAGEWEQWTANTHRRMC